MRERTANRWRRAPASDWPPGEARTWGLLDRNMVELVEALNSIDGVATTHSCGGHRHPTTAYQSPAGEWYVALAGIDAGPGGWRWRRAVALLRHVTADVPDVRLEEEDDDAAFLHGSHGADPDALAARIAALLESTG